MDTKELSVWGWIAMQCHRLGWHSSANVAEFLAGVDKEMWGEAYREAWGGKQHYYDMALLGMADPANFLIAVSRYRDIKVGCMASGYDCEKCKLAKKQGRCNQRGSISHFWEYVLSQDSQEEIDEELQVGMRDILEEIWLE